MSLDINSTNYLTVRRLWSILSSFKTKIATALGGKQDTLSTQTAYTSKGSATKVPQITTNTLGQVTGITEVTISGVTPASHATSATTYGIGTTANYGHVKLATGDMNGATHEDGVAVSKNHTHSQYLTSHQDISSKLNVDGSNATQVGTSAIVKTLGNGSDNLWNGDRFPANGHANQTTNPDDFTLRSTDHLLNFLFREGTGGWNYANLDSSMKKFGHAYGATIDSDSGCYGWKIGETSNTSAYSSAAFKAIVVVWEWDAPNWNHDGYSGRNFVGVLDITHRMTESPVSDSADKKIGTLTCICPMYCENSNGNRGYTVFVKQANNTHIAEWYIGRNTASPNMNSKIQYGRISIFPIMECRWKKFIVQQNSSISFNSDKDEYWGNRNVPFFSYSNYSGVGSNSLPLYAKSNGELSPVTAKNTCTNFLNSLDASTQQDITSDDVYIPTTSRDGTDLTTWYRRKVSGLRAGGGTEKILDIGRTNVSDTNYVNLRWKGSSVGSEFKDFAVFRTAQQSKDGTTPSATISDIPLDEAKKRILHSTYGTAVGSSSLPVYVDSSGNVTAVGSKMELPADSQAWVRVQQTSGASTYLDSEDNKGGVWASNGGTSKWLCYRDSNGASNFGVTTANSYDGIYGDGDTPCYFNGAQIAGCSYQNSSTSHYRWYFGKMTPGTTTTEKHFCGILEVNTISATSGTVRGTGFVGIVKIDARQATEFHVSLSIINNNGWPMSTLRPTLIVTDSGNERLFSIAFTNSNNALQAFQYTRFTLTGIGYFKEWVWDRWFSTSSTVTSNDWLWPASYDSDTVDGWHIQVGSVGTRSDTLYFT